MWRTYALLDLGETLELQPQLRRLVVDVLASGALTLRSANSEGARTELAQRVCRPVTRAPPS